MRLRALFNRFAVPAVAAGLAVTGLALPAQADDDKLEVPYVAISSPETVNVINGRSKTVKFDVFNLSAVLSEDVVLTFGTAENPVSPDLGLDTAANCDGNSCALGDLKPFEQRTVKFTVTPTGDAPAHRLAVSTTVGGDESDETVIALVRTTKTAADLEVGDIANLKVAQGKSAEVPVEVRNTGNADVKALGLVVMPVLGGIDPVLKYRNCLTDQDFGGLVCVFTEPIAAGSAFKLPEATPLRVKVGKDTPGPYEYPVFVAAVGLTEDFILEAEQRIAAASGAELKLESLATTQAEEPGEVEDLNPEDNYAQFSVVVPTSAADSAALGGVISGAVGDTKEFKVGFRNLGPSGTVPPSVNWLPYAHVKLPTGIALSQLDPNCVPGTTLENVDLENLDSLDGRDYVCVFGMDSLGKGKEVLFTFTGEILEGEHKAGAVTVDGGVQDSKSGNDKAALTVKIVETGGEGGGLPVTGAPAGLIAASGAVLLVGGFLAFRMARRRRIVTVVE